MSIRRLGRALLAGLLLTMLVSSIASAHVVKKVGPYTVAIGWLHEPTYVGVENAVEVIVKDKNGKAVDGISPDDFKVTITAAGQTSAALPLEASFDTDTGLGTHGEYRAAIIPTQIGDYTFHIVGTIKGTKIDQSVASSETTFDAVQTGADAQFPVKLPALSELAQKIDRVDARVSASAPAASAGAGADLAAAQQTANDAKDSANRALLVGAGVGALGVVFGLAGLFAASRAARPRAA